MSAWAARLAHIGISSGSQQQPEGHPAGHPGPVQIQDTHGTLKAWADDLETVRQAASEGLPPYDVFISHPGELKHTLISVLRQQFPAHVRTFTDAWELQHGHNSPAAMVKACGTARVGVVVISPDSVAKHWPMRELHILVDRHRRGEVGLVPLLWFDSFDEFATIVRQYQRCQDHRNLWAWLLKYVSQTCMVIKGELTAQRSLPEVMQEVTAACLRVLGEMAPSVAAEQKGAGKRPVGFDEQLASLLAVTQAGKWLWLHGQGGSGKTRMSTQLQHDLRAAGLITRAAVLSLEFTAGSGPTLSPEEATRLLAGAVRDLEGRDCSRASPEEIRRLFAEAAAQPGTLLVVDNVHSQEQLGLLLGEPLRLDSVPFVICTSRLQQPMGGSAHADVWAQVGHRLHHHAVQLLSPEAALQLFRAKCQRPETVPEAVEAHVVQACGCLPLAVLVVAGTLVGQDDVAAWMAAGQALLEGGDPADAVLAESEYGLQRMVQHSLLGLGPEALGMFLDTACVLCGRLESDALAVWRQWHGSRRAEAALRQLKNRNLLAGTDGAGQGVLWMHDVLRWYGRAVVRGAAELEGQRHKGSRLWVHNGQVEPQVKSGERHRVLAAHLDEPWAGELAMAGLLPDLGSVMETCDFRCQDPVCRSPCPGTGCSQGYMDG